MKDLTKQNSSLVTILDNTDSDTYVLDNKGSKLFLVTNLEAPNKRIVTVDAAAPLQAIGKTLFLKRKTCYPLVSVVDIFLPVTW